MEITFKYNQDYIGRMKEICGATYDAGDKKWLVPVSMFNTLENKFNGELMFMTPRWVITGEAPPDYRSLYNHVSNIIVPLKPPYKPYNFQSFGANFVASTALKYNYSCLFDDMGMGKTLQAILGGLILNHCSPYDHYTIPTLVVCKSSLKYQWITDGIDKFTNASSIVIDGTKKKRMKQYEELSSNQGKYQYVIVGYETIREDADILENVDIGLAIFDEAHKIRNKDTLLNKQCRKLKFKYSFYITGSPISKDPAQMFGIGLVGNKKFFGTWKSFKEDYVTAVKTQYGEELFFKNLDSLRGKIDSVSIRRTEKEVSLDMPKIIQQNIYVEMTKAQREIDEDLINRNAAYMEELVDLNSAPKTERNIEKRTQIEAALKGLIALRVGCANTSELFQLSKNKSVVKSYGELSKKDSGTSPKLKQLIEQVTEIVDGGNKIVVFTKFETMTRIIERELSKITGCVLFTGKMNSQEKEKARLKFKTDSNYNVFIGTNAAAEGLNLQEAKYLINFDLDWDIGINDQRNKRIRRLDSTFDKVYIYNYIAKGSMDEIVLKSLENNKRLFDYLIENDNVKSESMKLAMASY